MAAGGGRRRAGADRQPGRGRPKPLLVLPEPAPRGRGHRVARPHCPRIVRSAVLSPSSYVPIREKDRSVPLEPERRQALLAAKLGALVRDQWGGDERRSSSFPGGAALQATSAATGWVLVEDQPNRALG